jgi:O-antigen/teichoic acid export membrane protein
VVFAEEIVDVVGGPRFDSAAPVLQIFSVGVAMSYMAAVVVQGLIALGQQRMLLRLSLIGLVLNVALNLALIPIWGTRGAAVAFAATEVFALGLNLVVYARIAKAPRMQRSPQLLAAACVMALVVLPKSLPAVEAASPALVLAVGGLLSLTVYVCSLYALRAIPRDIHASVAGLLAPLRSRLPAR